MSEVFVVGHQPQFMPYIGILHKISRADIFIIVDHVQYVRKYFHNRTYIKLNNREHLLTIPVLSKGEFFAPINKIRINHQENWVKKQLRTLQLAYGKARFFNAYYPSIEAAYMRQYEYLSEFTSELLLFFLKEFELVEDIRFSSSMQIEGKKTDLLVELTKAVGGTTYISGEGARGYFDQEAFDKSGYRHIFNHFQHPWYPQSGTSFLTGLACVDLIFNNGKDGRKYIVQPENYPPPSADTGKQFLTSPESCRRKNNHDMSAHE